MDDECFRIRVVGVSHYQETVETLSAGERVYLCHEPDNPYDEMAVRVETSTGRVAGYLAKSCALRRAIFQEGRGIAAVVDSAGQSWAGMYGAFLSVTLTDDDIRIRSYYPDRAPPEPPPGGYRFWVDAALRSPAPSARTGSEKRQSA